MEFAELLAARFLTRGDTWVEQTADGRFSARRGLLGGSALARHLAGHVSLHAYALSPAGRPPLLAVDSALWGAFDIDVVGEAGASGRDQAWKLLGELHSAATGLVGDGPVALEETGGRGLHLWVFFEERVPATQVVRLMDAILSLSGRAAGIRSEEGDVVIERYPKQEALYGRVGSSLRVPLGVHPRSGRRSVFISADGARVGPEVALASALSTRALGTLASGLPARESFSAALSDRPAVVAIPRMGLGERPARPGAWETYAWLAMRLGLTDRTTRAPAHRATRHSVRCLFPERHAHGDRSGSGSAYLVLDGEAQLYGCAVCLETAVDTLDLIARTLDVASFPEVVALAEEIDPWRCREPWGKGAWRPADDATRDVPGDRGPRASAKASSSDRAFRREPFA